jgi:hypothetical protein
VVTQWLQTQCDWRTSKPLRDARTVRLALRRSEEGRTTYGWLDTRDFHRRANARLVECNVRTKRQIPTSDRGCPIPHLSGIGASLTDRVHSNVILPNGLVLAPSLPALAKRSLQFTRSPIAVRVEGQYESMTRRSALERTPKQWL